MQTKGIASLGVVSLLLFGFGCGATQRAQDRVVENAIENQIDREGGGNANVDVNNGTVRVETSEGAYQAGAGAGLPSDWPSDVPLMPGAQMQVSGSNNGSSGDAGAGVMFVTTKTAEEVSAYYREELTKNGWVFDTTASMNGFLVMTATKGDIGLSFSVQSASGQTTVVIGIDR
jgi:hypothetical protein